LNILFLIVFAVSSVIGGVITWWYHKGIIEAKKVAFMVFVGVCIVFQAITSDIYVFNKKTAVPPTPMPTTTPTTPINASTLSS